MSGRLALEDFGAPVGPRPGLFPSFLTPGAEAAAPAGPEPDPDAAAQYELGYRAGWEDCDRMMQERRLAVSEELARTLQDLAFTYHEARTHVLALVEPVLRAMTEKLLPGLAEEAFGRIVIAELAALAGEQAGEPLTLLVAPGCAGEIAELVGEAPPLACTVVPEPSLGPFQACFRLGARETLLDIDSVLARIAAATAATAAPAQPQRERALG